MTVGGSVWEVVGGADKGGILVRSEKSLTSKRVNGKLGNGALVRAVEHDVASGRLRYELIAGAGPVAGWVSTHSQGKELLAEDTEPAPELRWFDRQVAKEKERGGGLAELDAEGCQQQQQQSVTVSLPANVVYKAIFGRALGKKISGQAQPAAPKRGGAHLPVPCCPARPEEECEEEYGDDAPQVLCPHCQLPVGDFGYLAEDGEGELVHGECRAQLLACELSQKEDVRQREFVALKQERRAQFGIGWRAERIPRNLSLLADLQASPVEQCPYGLMWDEASRTVKVAPVDDATMSMNLEYLALAMQVRGREGREPLFSLDPVGDRSAGPADGPCDMMQAKRFEPQWLAGTSVGEVMFQADYHLKELSMGEYEQPVVGMKSVLDYSEAGAGGEWRSRAWFVVNRAEIRMSGGGVLVPRVDMGVEAREQIRGSDGVEDARITRADHPMVQYAGRFTHNFDLIAERRSVIHQLRELARASVAAKFLQDNQTRLDDAWFTQSGAVEGVCDAETIPQLWNERRYAKIRVEGGKIVDDEEELHSDVRGVYGGIEFGLEKPQVSTGLKTYLGPAGPRVKPARLSILQPLMRPAAAARPQGVDLNLDDFDLSAAPAVADNREAAGSWGGSLVAGGAFWKMLGDGPAAALKDEDQRLLKAVFNPHMSDRREEGDMFLPPDSHADYARKLRALVGEERGVREQRKGHFLGGAFERESPGALFPSSWASRQGIACGRDRQDRAGAAARDGWMPTESQALRLRETLKATTPSFDKCAEDGMRFRIYQVGSLEVRTTQEHEGEEVIGVVFSAASRRHAHAGSKERVVKETDAVVKVSQYVEDPRPPAGAGKPQPGGEQAQEHCRYFVALETEAGGVVVTEKLRDGMVTWAENPPDFDTRSSLAKVFRCVDCPGAGVTIRDIKSVRAAEVSWKRPSASASVVSKRYAEAIMEGAGALALPATGKCWAALTVGQRHAAEGLGVQGARAWDEGASEAWRAAWQDLAGPKRGAAEALGLDEAAWEKMGRDWARKQERSWSQLAAAERGAAGQLGVADAPAWATQRGPLWAMAWAELADQQADCPAAPAAELETSSVVHL